MTNEKNLASRQLLDTVLDAPQITKDAYALREIMDLLGIPTTMKGFEDLASQLNTVGKPEEPWKKKYVYNVYHQYSSCKPSPAFSHAIDSLRQRARLVPVGIAGSIYIQVLAHPGQVMEGTLVKRSLVTKRCARPGCAVQFIGPGIYHDPDCQREYAKERRKLSRQL